MFAIIVMTTLVFTILMFLVIMFIVYFDYILSIACLSLCLPTDTPYIPGYVVDHGYDTPIESFVVHFPNIGIQVGSSYEGR